jgi:hypothetical protein
MNRVFRHARISRCLQHGHFSNVINGVITRAAHGPRDFPSGGELVHDCIEQGNEHSECNVNIVMRRTIRSPSCSSLREQHSAGRLNKKSDRVRSACSCHMILDDEPAAKGHADPTPDHRKLLSVISRSLTRIRTGWWEARQNDVVFHPDRDGSSPESGETADEPPSGLRCPAGRQSNSSKLSPSIFRRRRTA